MVALVEDDRAKAGGAEGGDELAGVRVQQVEESAVLAAGDVPLQPGGVRGYLPGEGRRPIPTQPGLLRGDLLG